MITTKYLTWIFSARKTETTCFATGFDDYICLAVIFAIVFIVGFITVKKSRHNMKNLSLLLLTLIMFTSCHTENAGYSNTYTLTEQSSVRFYDSIDECIEKSDFIVRCTVSEIGDAYINGDAVLSENANENELHDYIRSIRTPVVLEVIEIYYDTTDSLGDSITVTEYRGTYNGYTLENSFPSYEVGHEYILFIKQAPDGETNIIMHQGSVELTSQARSENITPLFNTAIFESISTIPDLISAVDSFG